MTARQAFEAWYCKKNSIDSQARVIRMHRNAKGRYSSVAVQVAWRTWRKALDMKGEALAA